MTTNHLYYSPRTWGTGEVSTEIAIEVTLTKDDLGRYRVVLAETGQSVGFVWKPSGSRQWTSGIVNSAYFAIDADIMTTTALHPEHRGDSAFKLELEEGWSLREDAIDHILTALGRRRAEAVEAMIARARRPFIEAQAALGKDWAIETLAAAQ